MVRHNNLLPNGHFKKHWQTRVKTWFDQPGKKKSRRVARAKKAAAIAPRPVDGLLRPAVHCPTVRYNIKLRSGRGFTVDELKAANIRRKEALSIGIAVDHRRRNKCVESLQLNAQRLLAYKNKLIVFPRRANKPKKGDSSIEECKQATQFTGRLFPVVNDKNAFVGTEAIPAEKQNAFATLLKARNDVRMVGIRAKKAALKAEEEATKKK